MMKNRKEKEELRMLLLRASNLPSFLQECKRMKIKKSIIL
jgi:hypothetical protein